MNWTTLSLILVDTLFAFCLLRLVTLRRTAYKSALECARRDRLDGVAKWTRIDPKPSLGRPEGHEENYSLSLLRTLACWNPPRDGRLIIVASVHLGERFLLYQIDPNVTSGEMVNNLDRLSHCLLSTEDPELTDEWARELEITGSHFEESLSQ